MTSLPERDSPFRSQSYQDTDSDNHAKKRPRSSQAHDEFIRHFTGATEPRSRGRPRVSSKTPLSATHEIRRLRAQVASMEEELQELHSKWTEQLPDSRTLATAQHSAREKHEVIQTEATHNELQGVLLQQQLMFATLQSALLHAPLHSSGKEIFKALHFNTQLGRDLEEREKSLLVHHARSVATVPSAVDKFAQVAIDKVIAHRKGADIHKPVTPLSQIDITGCKDFSLISSVFISEIPHTSLTKVHEAISRYFDDIPAWMERHFGIEAESKRLNSADSPAVYWRLNLDGSGLPATVNHVLCSQLTNSYGVFHIDAITDDPLNPVSSTNVVKYGLNGITITPRKEPMTGKITSVTLRWLVVYRYNLLPDDPIIREELENIRPILNGDLITSAVCGYLQESQQSSPQSE
ncbi:hypothetical protein JG687_00006164 [Phytophthora cactorum]|uniref:Uncharacterized protein n=1 Tax=Phytophthora cactorum TaxID=29920 RepID=A0A8T1ULV1_9STRA|nr:hypothetical protein PC120_g14332 [Phytophthora cactorum]KAG3069114.1 hypothetical protein PC121_g9926 [Phytophthora cactorum]KAG3184078.1 hypothetical protein PC128_g13899 [Phytophthora cactorum]KAG4040552.1 hypothetical protein PC123_g23911 [Phytophthora cactorum]KAG6964137.1 hypothetical protein JG687_00006164 [Phytophthora cactorum]